MLGAVAVTLFRRPVEFYGARTINLAKCLLATLRQGLLLHEIVRSCNKPQAPIIGKPITEDRMAMLESDPRGFLAWLREHTLSLGDNT